MTTLSSNKEPPLYMDYSVVVQPRMSYALARPDGQ